MGHPLKNYRTSNQPFGSYATAGVVGSYYGTEVQYLVAEYGNYQPYGHAGADYPTPVGTPVYAISEGTVLWAGWAEDLPNEGGVKKWLLYANFPGIVTVIQHSWGISLTAHMSEAWLNVGQHVAEGQQIGLTGNTKARGEYVGAHVHIEALVDLSYRTGGGLIYGRTNPEQFYGTINNSSTTTETKEWDELASKEEVKQAAKEAIDGWSISDGFTKRLDGRSPVDFLIQLRAEQGGLISSVRGLTATVNALAGLVGAEQGLDVEEVKAAVKAAIAESVVKVDVSVNGVAE